mmetsp:Transcript_61432/g.72983  ORF Transcript_61432/g.72983 Transcript_61432/m.72983 type:complete len:272 (+) Transcript_61432:254-1069(+)
MFNVLKRDLHQRLRPCFTTVIPARNRATKQRTMKSEAFVHPVAGLKLGRWRGMRAGVILDEFCVVGGKERRAGISVDGVRLAGVSTSAGGGVGDWEISSRASMLCSLSFPRIVVTEDSADFVSCFKSRHLSLIWLYSVRDTSCFSMGVETGRDSIGWEGSFEAMFGFLAGVARDKSSLIANVLPMNFNSCGSVAVLFMGSTGNHCTSAVSLSSQESAFRSGSFLSSSLTEGGIISLALLLTLVRPRDCGLFVSGSTRPGTSSARADKSPSS